jgi:hypothetical protein
MWAKLQRCFDYAEVELSNNLAENSMRPVALGRKNWLHVGGAQAGPKVAAILSLVESCRRLGGQGLLQRRAARIEPPDPLRGRQSHPNTLVDQPRLITLGSSDAYGRGSPSL